MQKYWSVSDELNFTALTQRYPFLEDINLRGKVYGPHVTAPWASASQDSVPEAGESK